ncbi:hypothetical protein [Nocardioides limicola]|uniref:hypothetical protein n=1 Tax=Nocardioides limicola TaxID=2803368 RepID=UPI00193B3A0B|nr:hypothetical protein [Nocardioides sp. DJM-14]
MRGLIVLLLITALVGADRPAPPAADPGQQSPAATLLVPGPCVVPAGTVWRGCPPSQPGETHAPEFCVRPAAYRGGPLLPCGEPTHSLIEE